ncbi:MAG: hypothetical protein AB1898_21440 [Acidobacteriota bacterium]
MRDRQKRGGFSRSVILAILFGLQFQAMTSYGQIFSPKVLVKGQPDASSLVSLARGICEAAGAVTPREKAEAIWRFFLTDGRFVKPSFWYHIAGWAYEEPAGEVLDPLRLLNSYGFGLCYHLAPLLEAIYEAAGFQDARVWFLTGHTVAEVYYDGAYHYFDSDMLGYNTVGQGDPRKLPVASVRQLEQNPNIVLQKLLSPTRVDSAQVDSPWYPADVREAAMNGLAELFTTTEDNWVFPFTRYPQGHSMEFVLRPGERLTRYFQPEHPQLYYLPYRFDGKVWQEFPQESAQYAIRTEDGPKSQKDYRHWGTGRQEYRPVLSREASYYPRWEHGFNENLRLPQPGSQNGALTRRDVERPATAVFEMPSLYVVIDATFGLQAHLASPQHRLKVETSTDQGLTWQPSGHLAGPFDGPWETEPQVLARSEHGRLTAVSGSYGYLLRVTLEGPGPAQALRLSGVDLQSRFQLNPRTLPHLSPGRNSLIFSTGKPMQRRPIPVPLENVDRLAARLSGITYKQEQGQGFLLADGSHEGEVVFELRTPDGALLTGFHAGGRFLDIRDGLVPDKLTAEVRKLQFKLGAGSERPGFGRLEWSSSLSGPFQSLWTYVPPTGWKDQPLDRVLLWPEVDRSVETLPAECRRVFVRYRIQGSMGLDNVRLAVTSSWPAGPSQVKITHIWKTPSGLRSHSERVNGSVQAHAYTIDLSGKDVTNHAIVFHHPTN